MVTYLKTDNEQLLIEGKSAEELVKEFGSPLYVFSANTIRENCKQIVSNFKRYLKNTIVCYAYKANSIAKICEVIANCGLGAEISSGFELWLASKFLKGDKIVFNSPAKKIEELRMAIEQKLLLVNIDSLPELQKIRKIAMHTNRIINIGIRINPEIKLPLSSKISKLGITVDDTSKVCKFFCNHLNSKHIQLKGIHFHLGFQIIDPQHYLKAIRRSFEVIKRIKKADLMIDFLDIGGGFAEPSLLKMKRIHISDFARIICEEIKKEKDEVNLSSMGLILEPGRYIVANSGIILTQVQTIKQMRDRTWIITDGGLNLYHPLTKGNFVYTIANKATKKADASYSIGGPLCMGADVFTRNVRLPQTEEGDILAILNAGAYTSSLSNQFMYPRPTALLIDNKKVEIARKKEKYDDMVW